MESGLKNQVLMLWTTGFFEEVQRYISEKSPLSIDIIRKAHKRTIYRPLVNKMGDSVRANSILNKYILEVYEGYNRSFLFDSEDINTLETMAIIKLPLIYNQEV